MVQFALKHNSIKVAPLKRNWAISRQVYSSDQTNTNVPSRLVRLQYVWDGGHLVGNSAISKVCITDMIRNLPHS